MEILQVRFLISFDLPRVSNLTISYFEELDSLQGLLFVQPICFANQTINAKWLLIGEVRIHNNYFYRSNPYLFRSCLL